MTTLMALGTTMLVALMLAWVELMCRRIEADEARATAPPTNTPAVPVIPATDAPGAEAARSAIESMPPGAERDDLTRRYAELAHGWNSTEPLARERAAGAVAASMSVLADHATRAREAELATEAEALAAAARLASEGLDRC